MREFFGIAIDENDTNFCSNLENIAKGVNEVKDLVSKVNSRKMHKGVGKDKKSKKEAKK